MKLQTILDLIKENPNTAFFYSPFLINKNTGLRRKNLSKNKFSYLFNNYEEIVEVTSVNYKKQFKKIEKLISKNLLGYSLINYEAGFLFEEKLFNFLDDDSILMRFVFSSPKQVEKINSKKILIDPFNHNEFSITGFKLNTNKNQFISSIKKIKKYIEEGDTYQVNYTVKGNFKLEGNISRFINSLLFNQTAQFTSIINSGNGLIISLSPELFFETDFNSITTRPMKGTIKRGISLQDDSFQMAELNTSEKDKAENLMIVDLLRNDLGRISKYGSVKVQSLFDIEKYESLYQMTSTINSRLKNKVCLTEILKNLFPCGSITGAPKIRTMEIISELEKEKRNIYTGSIGLILKKKAVFNVAIRTIELDKKGNGNIGLGSGIVWDSKPENEFDEVLLKSNFLLKQEDYFEIFESMLVQKNEIQLLDKHIERLEKTADFFLFNFDKEKIMRYIRRNIKLNKLSVYKLKLTLNKNGDIKIDTSPVIDYKNSIKAIISEKTISSKNKFQYFKTTKRELYNNQIKIYSQQGFFDVLFMNENSFITEGAITNIFIKKDDIIITPPLQCGALNGIFRKNLISLNPQIVEKHITLKDIMNSDEVFLTNAVRGIVWVNQLYFNTMNYITLQVPEKSTLNNAV